VREQDSARIGQVSHETLLLLLLLLLLLFVITFTHGIYNYTNIPETNHVPTLYNVAVTLLLQYMTHVMLSPTINPLYCTSALPAVCVQCPVWLFCLVPGHFAFLVRCSVTF